MPVVKFAISAHQAEVMGRCATEIMDAFVDPLLAVAGLAQDLARRVAVREREEADVVRVPAASVSTTPLTITSYPPEVFWTRRDGFLHTEAPPPPTHFAAYDLNKILVCLSLRQFPDGVTHTDQWTPQAVLRAFQRIHGDVWDDVVQILVEPPSRGCSCRRGDV